jgi:hypothetical protein
VVASLFAVFLHTPLHPCSYPTLASTLRESCLSSLPSQRARLPYVLLIFVVWDSPHPLLCHLSLSSCLSFPLSRFSVSPSPTPPLSRTASLDISIRPSRFFVLLILPFLVSRFSFRVACLLLLSLPPDRQKHGNIPQARPPAQTGALGVKPPRPLFHLLSLSLSLCFSLSSRPSYLQPPPPCSTPSRTTTGVIPAHNPPVSSEKTAGFPQL